MKAILMKKAGEADVLQMADIPEPELRNPECIKVRLHAAGINPVDFKMRNAGTFFPDKLPAILGCDGAGVVESIGESVTRFKAGDEVYFFNGGIGGPEQGNYAEYTMIHQEYAARKPKNLSMTDAAGVPLVWITACEALMDRAGLEKNQSVLIHAGAGGVGHVAIQIAKGLGARVATTISGKEKAEFAQSMGAEYLIDYQKKDFVEAVLDWTDGKGVDVVFDTVGNKTFCHSFGAAKIYGKVVTLLEGICDSNAIKVAKMRNLSIIYELMLTPMHLGMHKQRVAQRRILEEATRRIESGEVSVKVSEIFSLNDVAKAHQLIEKGHMTGKIVLSI
ncbi:MAG: zinc-dependent alcohol dehydrogenase family protein [Desulfobacterales bacterium]